MCVYVLWTSSYVVAVVRFILLLQESQIKRIFGTMISQKLQDFDEDVKPLADVMTQATIEIYNFIATRMLPTPTKIHYLFNLRDISKASLKPGSQYTQPLTRHGHNAVARIGYSCVKSRDNHPQSDTFAFIVKL